MLKKLFTVSILFFLTACSREVTNYPNAKYKITDKEVKKYILELNNREQCIYPQLAELSYEEAEAQVYSKQSDAEKKTWDYMSNRLLSEIIGDNYAFLEQDEDSANYFIEKHNRLNNQKAKVDPKSCALFKEDFESFLEGARGCGCSK